MAKRDKKEKAAEVVVAEQPAARVEVEAEGTIFVELKHNWFSPDAVRYKPSGNPHSLPAKFKNGLPKTARVLDGAEVQALRRAQEEEKKKAEQGPKTFSEMTRGRPKLTAAQFFGRKKAGV